MTRLLLGVDLAVLIVGAGLWLSAALLGVALRDTSQRNAPRLPLFLGFAAVAVLLGRIVVVVLLAGSGWWFVEEKVILALPIAILCAALAAVFAGPELARQVRARRPARLTPRAATALLFAGFGGVAALAIQFVVGYPLQPLAAVELLAITFLCCLVTWFVFARRSRRTIVGAAGLLALCVAATSGWAWATDMAGWANIQSLPSSHHAEAPGVQNAVVVSVESLRTPATAEPDEYYDLTARQQEVTLPSGTVVKAWTFGSLPGPELRVHQGDLVEVVLHNKDIAKGVTLHFHGYSLPNGEDGVAGVTQNAVLPGESFSYRFVASQVGTYWYHSHQASAEGVVKGLFGSLIVEPRTVTKADLDLAVPIHAFGRVVTLGESDRESSHVVAPGSLVRLRLINTDQLPQRFAIGGTKFRVVAIDGHDLSGPQEISDQLLRIPAGGRLDVEFSMPSSVVKLAAEAAPNATISFTTSAGDAGAGDAPPNFDHPQFDPLNYGTGGVPSFGQSFSVAETLVLDRELRFLHGVPVYAYTVNGAVYPHIPATIVHQGDLVEFTIVNRSAETHPMHPHGHHVLVLSRNGIVPRTAIWLDTVDVEPGDTWTVAMVADNPGIWMDHCHNLDHAAQGMMFEIQYSGVESPFVHGGVHTNDPE